MRVPRGAVTETFIIMANEKIKCKNFLYGV